MSPTHEIKPATRELTVNLDDDGSIASILAPHQTLSNPHRIMVKNPEGNIRMGNIDYEPTPFQPVPVPGGLLFKRWPEGMDPVAHICSVLARGFWTQGVLWCAHEASEASGGELENVLLSPIHPEMGLSTDVAVTMTAVEALNILEDGLRHASPEDHRGTALDLLGLLVDGQDDAWEGTEALHNLTAKMEVVALDLEARGTAIGDKSDQSMMGLQRAGRGEGYLEAARNIRKALGGHRA